MIPDEFQREYLVFVTILERGVVRNISADTELVRSQSLLEYVVR